MKFDKKEIAAKASILYYEKNKSQNEIARDLNISRSYVSQLLTYARDIGLVKIIIEIDQFKLRMIKKELDFKAKFPSLKQLYIMSSESEEFTNDNIGKFSAPYIIELLNDSKVIGANLGHSIEKVIKELHPQDFSENTEKFVVQTMGGFNYNEINGSVHPNELVNSLSRILHCNCYFLNCPAIVDNPTLREALMTENSIKTIVNLWDRIDLALIGIGVINKKSRLFNLFNDKMVSVMKENNIACDLNGNFFDISGNYIPLFENHKISIPYKQLKAVKNKVVIGHGKYKKEAILSALRANMIDVLFTDSITIDEIEQEMNK